MLYPFELQGQDTSIPFLNIFAPVIKTLAVEAKGKMIIYCQSPGWQGLA